MKVILKQAVPKLGKADQVLNVADGYARNYLFPRDLAILADRSAVKNLEAKTSRMAAKSADLVASAKAHKETIDGKTIRIQAKAGKDTTKLFGAVTPQEVENAIREQLGVTVDRKNIALVESIRRLGSYRVDVSLHREVDAHVTVVVFDPEVEAVAEAVAAPVEEVEEA